MNEVRLPWPAKELSPNARCHWAMKAAAAKQYRADCFYLAKQAKVKAKWEGPIHVSLLFCAPDLRHRDLDNCLSSAKALCDGLADALGVNDSRFSLSLAMGEPHDGGAVYATISQPLVRVG